MMLWGTYFIMVGCLDPCTDTSSVSGSITPYHLLLRISEQESSVTDHVDPLKLGTHHVAKMLTGTGVVAAGLFLGPVEMKPSLILEAPLRSQRRYQELTLPACMVHIELQEPEIGSDVFIPQEPTPAGLMRPEAQYAQRPKGPDSGLQPLPSRQLGDARTGAERRKRWTRGLPGVRGCSKLLAWLLADPSSKVPPT